MKREMLSVILVSLSLFAAGGRFIAARIGIHPLARD
jgi:hypothetical protein